MTAHKPPVPPEQQSPYRQSDQADSENGGKAQTKPSEDSSGRGRAQNLTENASNKGFQQDR